MKLSRKGIGYFEEEVNIDDDNFEYDSDYI